MLASGDSGDVPGSWTSVDTDNGLLMWTPSETGGQREIAIFA